MRELASCVGVIPCFNEGATIGPLVSEVLEHLTAVIVVDDGSGDDTSARARSAGAIVLTHGRNFGKGVALRTGLSLASQRGFDWGATLDGDGQHAPADLAELLRCAELTGALMVIGNRMHDARAMPWLRRRVNFWMSRQLSRRVGRALPDTQSGFRLIHLPAWASLPLHTERFEVESEMLMGFLGAGFPVAFASIQVIAPGRGSHIRPASDTWRWWKWWRSMRRNGRWPDQPVVRPPDPAFPGRTRPINGLH